MPLLNQLVNNTLLGKSLTGKNTYLYNEPFESSPIIHGENIWADSINRASPTHPSNYNIVSDFIDLDLIEIPGTNKTSYYCRLSETVPTSLLNKINPITKQLYSPYDRVGNLISNTFGFNFSPRLYYYDEEVTLLDESNWVLDHFAGIITQEYNKPINKLKAYVYIGRNIIQAIQVSNHRIIFYDRQTIDNGITGIVDGINDTFYLNNIPDLNSEYVFINGILQSNEDYSILINKIIFSEFTIPQIDDTLLISYRSSGTW